VRLTIDLSGIITTGTELLLHLEALGEYYSALWTVDLENVEEHLVYIRAKGDVDIRIRMQEATGCPPMVKSDLTGLLLPSSVDEEDEHGFQAQYIAEGMFEGCTVASSITLGAAWNPLANRAIG
jgi:hypothetical protein